MAERLWLQHLPSPVACQNSVEPRTGVIARLHRISGGLNPSPPTETHERRGGSRDAPAILQSSGHHFASNSRITSSGERFRSISVVAFRYPSNRRQSCSLPNVEVRNHVAANYWHPTASRMTSISKASWVAASPVTKSGGFGSPSVRLSASNS